MVRDIYDAWTRSFGKWFAQPGELVTEPEAERPFFYNRHDWERHAHYGRFLELVENERVTFTVSWVMASPRPGLRAR